MATTLHSSLFRATCVGILSTLLACGGGGGAGTSVPFGGSNPAAGNPPHDVTITAVTVNPVSYWNDVATTTINVAATATGSPAEQRPITTTDLATVHIAIYDAVGAITGTHRPFAVTPSRPASGTDASEAAAIGAAAYGVLKGLFPARADQYQAPYDRFVATLTGSDAARDAGLALGTEIANGVLSLRANDGRSVVLAPYVPGTGPGQFRGLNPINRFLPAVKPFSMLSSSQFRVPAPPTLDSGTYAQDFNETRTLGGTVSSLRTDAQLEIGRFHTEPPPRFWPRNLRKFIMTDRSLTDHARLMAMLMVAQADAEIGCFESKYFYQFWRPQSAIPLAAADGNDATVADAAWTPVVPTPNHPEYPAAHACVAGAVTEIMTAFYGTDRVAFTFDSTVTNSTHSFDSVSALVDEIRWARIYGGMHFRSALMQGHALGTNVARQVALNHFQPL